MLYTQKKQTRFCQPNGGIKMSKNNEAKIISFPEKDNQLKNKSIKTEYSIHFYTGTDPELHNNRLTINGRFDNLEEAYKDYNEFFKDIDEDFDEDTDYEAEIEFFRDVLGHEIETFAGIELIKTVYIDGQVSEQEIIESFTREDFE